jgi:hypothetical protein
MDSSSSDDEDIIIASVSTGNLKIRVLGLTELLKTVSHLSKVEPHSEHNIIATCLS